MAILKQGGSNPYAGKVNTSMGMREPRPPLCMVCGERREGQIYTVNANGQTSCATCAGPKHAKTLLGVCDPVDEPTDAPDASA